MGTNYFAAGLGAQWQHLHGPHGPSQLVRRVVTWSGFALKVSFALSAKDMEKSSISADYPVKCVDATL